jgi:hypothetical protein
MSQNMQTFGDIIDGIMEAVGVQSDDTRARNKIKRFINMAYVDEVLPFKRWQWLEKTVQVVHKAYYSTDTASVAPESTTVTLSTTPSVSLGSFKNYKFSVDGSNKVYTISAHTAGGTTITLSSAFQEAADTEAEFKIWRDRIDLPTTAKETVEIWHSEQNKPLEAIGSQRYRALEARDPKLEGFPAYYNTTDFYDPSSGDGESESDRYRQTRIYPAINTTPITLNIDYIEEITELDDDTDEPVIPVGDRIVLYYLAGAMAWSIINRNEEMHDKFYAKGQAKLARMAGERDDGMDTPTLSPKSEYLNAIRRSGLRRKLASVAANGGSPSVALPTFLRDVTIEGGNLTDDLTADTGVLIDGRDISEDGAILDDLVSPTEVALTDNTTNGVAATFALATYNVLQVMYSISEDGTENIEAGIMTICANSTSVAVASGPVAEASAVSTTLDADISGGNIRLLYTTTSTGNARTLNYRLFKWLG